jgi:oligopeptide/dipeptide ABC transporter ATP-binding protein
MSEKELNKKIRWNEISFIPQGSMSSLDPLYKIQEQAVTIAKAHGNRNEKDVIERLRTLFDVVGLPPERVSDYPHEFSGGMQQRAIIALAFLLEPNLITADEPTTALDVIMEDQVFKYLSEIKESTATSMVLITHDISLVFESCERMAIMHGGQIAESGPTTDVFDNPVHPYSILLQQSFPDIRYPGRELVSIKGEPPEVIGQADYCTFEDRCPLAIDECRNSEPLLEPIDDEGHQAACFQKDNESAIHELRNQRMATKEGQHE